MDEDEHKQWIANREREREDLWWALRTRLLTDDEMKQVRGWGDRLNVALATPYNGSEKRKELNDALANQAMLQMAKAKAE